MTPKKQFLLSYRAIGRTLGLSHYLVAKIERQALAKIKRELAPIYERTTDNHETVPHGRRYGGIHAPRMARRLDLVPLERPVRVPRVKSNHPGSSPA